jgi:hypothetical protein
MEGKIAILYNDLGLVSLDMFDDFSLTEDIKEQSISTNCSGN